MNQFTISSQNYLQGSLRAESKCSLDSTMQLNSLNPPLSIKHHSKIIHPQTLHTLKKHPSTLIVSKPKNTFIQPPPPILAPYQALQPSPRMSNLKFMANSSALHSQQFNFSSHIENSNQQLSFQSIFHQSNIFNHLVLHEATHQQMFQQQASINLNSNLIGSPMQQGQYGGEGRRQARVKRVVPSQQGENSNSYQFRNGVEESKKKEDEGMKKQMEISYGEINQKPIIKEFQQPVSINNLKEKEVLVEIDDGESEAIQANKIVLQSLSQQQDGVIEITQSFINELKRDLLNLLLKYQEKFENLKYKEDVRNFSEEIKKVQIDFILSKFQQWVQIKPSSSQESLFDSWYDFIRKEIQQFLNEIFEYSNKNLQYEELKQQKEQANEGISEEIMKFNNKKFRIVGNQIYGLPLDRKERLVHIKKYFLKKKLMKQYKRDIDYECRKKHADTRPRDESGRFLNKNSKQIIVNSGIKQLSQKLKKKNHNAIFKSSNEKNGAWIERIKREQTGFHDSLSKGLSLDLIKTIKLDQNTSSNIFNISPKAIQDQGHISANQLYASENKVNKDRILSHFLSQMKLKQIAPNPYMPENLSFKMPDYVFPEKSKQKINMRNDSLSKLPSGNQQYGTNPPMRVSQSLSTLPPIRKAKQFMPHRVDLGHPSEYVEVNIQNNRSNDEDILYDNQRDQTKVQNRSYSPNNREEQAQVRLDASKLKNKFMAMSVENPFKDAKQYDYYKDTKKKTIKMEKKRYLDNIDSRRGSEFDLPEIDNHFTTRHRDSLSKFQRQILNYKRDHEMVHLLQPFKKQIIKPSEHSPGADNSVLQGKEAKKNDKTDTIYMMKIKRADKWDNVKMNKTQKFVKNSKKIEVDTANL